MAATARIEKASHAAQGSKAGQHLGEFACRQDIHKAENKTCHQDDRNPAGKGNKIFVSRFTHSAI